MEADAQWLEQEGRTKSFLPKLTAEPAPLSRKVEAAGIEPASEVARDPPGSTTSHAGARSATSPRRSATSP
jgi:hypothetical protein